MKKGTKHRENALDSLLPTASLMILKLPQTFQTHPPRTPQFFLIAKGLRRDKFMFVLLYPSANEIYNHCIMLSQDNVRHHKCFDQRSSIMTRLQ